MFLTESVQKTYFTYLIDIFIFEFYNKQADLMLFCLFYICISSVVNCKAKFCKIMEVTSESKNTVILGVIFFSRFKIYKSPTTTSKTPF